MKELTLEEKALLMMDGSIIPPKEGKQGDAEGPIKTLRAFRRVHIPAGKSVNVGFELKDKELEWWDEQTNTVRVCPGSYEVMVGGSSKEEDLQRMTIVIPRDE